MVSDARFNGRGWASRYGGRKGRAGLATRVAPFLMSFLLLIPCLNAPQIVNQSILYWGGDFSSCKIVHFPSIMGLFPW
ncbi:hypothetical protein OPV22_026058 [Ensete ventricosum]|uniref:Uncharacterized protein n=1 Tax=Ensete ventricosum TaxID=4639 RepID=A0AAV8QBK1_ENSVE|nr:hypothetical protein OPV22_026058 [Ensete ventricosum]